MSSRAVWSSVTADCVNGVDPENRVDMADYLNRAECMDSMKSVDCANVHLQPSETLVLCIKREVRKFACLSLPPSVTLKASQLLHRLPTNLVSGLYFSRLLKRLHSTLCLRQLRFLSTKKMICLQLA